MHSESPKYILKNMFVRSYLTPINPTVRVKDVLMLSYVIKDIINFNYYLQEHYYFDNFLGFYSTVFEAM